MGVYAQLWAPSPVNGRIIPCLGTLAYVPLTQGRTRDKKYVEREIKKHIQREKLHQDAVGYSIETLGAGLPWNGKFELFTDYYYDQA